MALAQEGLLQKMNGLIRLETWHFVSHCLLKVSDCHIPFHTTKENKKGQREKIKQSWLGLDSFGLYTCELGEVHLLLKQRSEFA